MHRDLLFLSGGRCLSTDFSQSVGPLPNDQLKVSLERTVDMAIRTAISEIICIGGTVENLVFTNSLGDVGYHVIQNLVTAYEILLDCEIEFIVSSESNFTPKETAVGVTAIGQVGLNKTSVPPRYDLKLYGTPLVGQEVLERPLPSLRQVQKLIQDPNISGIIPVGSKGIYQEAMQIGDHALLQAQTLGVDIHKSAGPATCFLVLCVPGTVVQPGTHLKQR